MSIRGLVDGPDQIADGEVPTQLAAVDTDGNLLVKAGVDSQSRTAKAIVVDPAGRLIISDSDKLTAMLIELRTLNQLVAMMAAGRIVTDDPEDFRLDADLSGLGNALSN